MMKTKCLLVIIGCCAILVNAYSQEYSNEGNSTKETMKMNNLKFMNDNDEQLVCKLTGPELMKRKNQIREQLFSRVKNVEEIETGYNFFFDYDPDLILKLTDWIITENSCCPFFTFNTTLHGENNVRLQMTGPEKAKELIKSLIVDQIANKK